jgi:6-phosphogluconate dehydrogenase
VQGFQLLKAGSTQNNWNLSLQTIAAIWRNGCIIRSAFLDEIKQAYQNNPTIESLMFAAYFQETISNGLDDLREMTVFAINQQIPVPGLSAAVSYFDSITSEILPTNLIQAQRDYFGAHGYRRIDTGEETHHTDWKSN